MKPAIVPNKIGANPFEKKDSEVKPEIVKPAQAPNKIAANPFEKKDPEI